MGKVTAANALRLKEYIDAIDDFHLIVPEPCLYEDHIGALFTDAILQAGVNYKRVVWPRVKYVLETFPYADTVHSFSGVLTHYGTSNVIRWNNKEKIHRIEELVSFCTSNDIDTAEQLKVFLKYNKNVSSLKGIHGIGDKTCDYLKRLLGFDVVAVDRHIRTFLSGANICCGDYNAIKEIVEFAADFMDCARRELDYSIWSYMSEKEHRAGQLTIDFYNT